MSRQDPNEHVPSGSEYSSTGNLIDSTLLVPTSADICQTMWSSAVQICPICLLTVLPSHQQAGFHVFVPAEGGIR